jgi:hypothetical protein
MFSIWSRKQTTKFAIETADIPTSQESFHVEITNEDGLRHEKCSRSQGAVKQFLAQKSATVMYHPPYSPDLAPNGLWLFP